MNQTTTAQLSLTDAECDAIIAGALTAFDFICVNTVDWALYRRSQYANFDEAVRHGAIVGGDDVLGYSAALDTFDAMIRAVDLMDHRASEDDVRVVITVNRTFTLPECALADAAREIHRHMIRMGWYVR